MGVSAGFCAASRGFFLKHHITGFLARSVGLLLQSQVPGDVGAG